MVPDAVDLSEIQRVLVVKLRHHGDVLLTSPVFSVLKEQGPHLEIDALVYLETEDMLSGHPAINRVFTIDRQWRQAGLISKLRYERQLMRELGVRHYQLLIHLTENPRGVMLARKLRPRYSVAMDYAHRRGRLWANSFTHLYKIPDPVQKPRHVVEKNLDALRRIGIYPGPERSLTLVPGKTATGQVEKLMHAHGVIAGQYIHIHPTSRWLFKSWTIEKNIELINQLMRDGHRVVLTGPPDERERQVCQKIVEGLESPCIDLSGQLTLKQLAALTAQAKCFVGVDSAPMHIAAAMQTPVVVLFGPSGDLEWGPWQVVNSVITSNHSCRPCGMDGCGGGKISECLTTIPVNEVYAAVKHHITS